MLSGVTTGDVTSTWEPKRTGTKATPKRTVTPPNKHFTYRLLKLWVFEALLTMMKLLYLGIMLLDAFHLRQNLLKHSA